MLQGVGVDVSVTFRYRLAPPGIGVIDHVLFR